VLCVQLHVHMGGRAVPNSPVTVALQPGPVCLDRTDVQGASSPCTAGEEQRLVIVAADAYRHLTDTDGAANFVVQTSSKSQCFDGESQRVLFNQSINQSINQSANQSINLMHQFNRRVVM